MADTCLDCGCKLRNGVCPNCDEETAIMEQIWHDGTPIVVSDEFVSKVEEQRIRIRGRCNDKRRYERMDR